MMVYLKLYQLIYKKGLFPPLSYSSDKKKTHCVTKACVYLFLFFFHVRIHCIFSLWLSHYWNDFYGTQARKHIILFLDRISKYDSHTPICDSLAPLVVREPPTYDPDNVWGLVDDVQEEEPSTPIKRNEKKDSGYASGTFTFVPSSPTKSDAPPFTLKRLSSTTTQPPTLLSPNLNRILLRSHGKAVTHSGSHPDLKSSYAATSHHNTELPRRAEFAGGLINIDNATKQSYPPSSISRSLATTSGGRWTTSLGNQLLASSFISTFRQNKSEKDQAGHNYKLFIKASDTSIADQLTWIESELFSKIKVKIYSFFAPSPSLKEGVRQKNLHLIFRTVSRVC